MKVIACIALHYGIDYLAWAIRNIDAAVDEIHIFYTKNPSFGFSEGRTCPDSEEALRAESLRFATKPVIWHMVSGVQHEGQHRDLFWHQANARGADLCLVVDSDEIWEPEALKQTLESIYRSNYASRWLARFASCWRSFKLEVHDGFRPVRVIDMRQTPGPGLHKSVADGHLDETMQPKPVLHFGYAIRTELMRYKWTCHGHQYELRPGWVEGVYCNWTPDMTNLHPVANGVWDRAHPTRPEIAEQIETTLADHPYHGLEIIP